MYVVAVLVVPMSVMQVVDVILMLDRLATVPVGVGITVVGVHLGLWMPFAVVHVVHVVAVQHCRTAVIRQVLVIDILDMRAHLELLRAGVAY